MRQLLFGVCQLRTFAFSIPTAPIFSLWSIARGGGETHILRTLDVIERGIVLIFIPLFTLLADVMHQFEEYNPTWGNVGVYHLDELYDCN